MPTFEQRIHIRARPADVFAFLTRPENVPLFAPGIDEAVLAGGSAGLQGSSLGLRTRSGRELRAQITHFHENEGWRVVDEHGTVAHVQVEPDERDGTLLTATLAGSWNPATAAAVQAEWEQKLGELPKRLAP